MKFEFKFINKTPLFLATEKSRSEMVKILLSCEKIDVNAKSILKQNFLNIVFHQFF